MPNTTGYSFREVLISDWHGAGLPKASLIKPVLATIEQRLILRKLGALQGGDIQALRSVLRPRRSTRRRRRL